MIIIVSKNKQCVKVIENHLDKQKVFLIKKKRKWKWYKEWTPSKLFAPLSVESQAKTIKKKNDLSSRHKSTFFKKQVGSISKIIVPTKRTSCTTAGGDRIIP